MIVADALTPASPAGRNTKLTPKTINTVARVLREGNTDAVACSRAKISTASFYSWLATGRDVEKREDGAELTEHEARCLEFLEAVTSARDKAEEIAVSAVWQAIKGYDSAETTTEIWYRTEKDEKGKEIKVPVTTTRTKTWHTAPNPTIALEYLARTRPERWAKKADIQINNNNLNLITADDIESALERADEKRRRLLDQYSDSE